MLFKLNGNCTADQEAEILENINNALAFWTQDADQEIIPDSDYIPHVTSVNYTLFQVYDVDGEELALYSINNAYTSVIEKLWEDFYRNVMNCAMDEDEFDEAYGEDFFCDYEACSDLNENDFPDFCKWCYPEMDIERVFVQKLIV